MEIVLITHISPQEQNPKMTGIGRCAFKLLNGLKKNEQNKVTVYSTKKKSIMYDLIKSIIGKDISSVVTAMPLWYPFRKLSRTAVIHITSQTLTIPLAWQKPKQRVIVTVHDIIPYTRNEYNSIWEKILYKFSMKRLRNATHIIADSDHTKNDLMHFLQIPEEKISVVYLGVDRAVFFPENERKKKSVERQKNTILYVGSETKRKNLRVLLKAVAEVKKQIPTVKLIKIGVPEDKKEHTKLQDLANELHITENIIWKGYVESLADEYRRATVFVLPSLYEGFGFPIIEAMACGCPVISSNKTSLPELARDAALYFDGHDHDALAQHIYAVLTNKELQKKLQEKGIRNVKSFSWDKSIDSTEEVYRIFSH